MPAWVGRSNTPRIASSFCGGLGRSSCAGSACSTSLRLNCLQRRLGSALQLLLSSFLTLDVKRGAPLPHSAAVLLSLLHCELRHSRRRHRRHRRRPWQPLRPPRGAAQAAGAEVLFHLLRAFNGIVGEEGFFC